MQSGLLVLLRLEAWAAVRRLLRGVRTPSGAILFALVVAAIGSWLGLILIPVAGGEKTSPEAVQRVAPLVLLAVSVLTIVATVGGQADFFSPSEIDFLFAAPFSRQALLLYKVGKGLLGALPTALVCTALSLKHVGGWVAGYVGFVLGLVFIQLGCMAFLLLNQLLAERAYSRIRQLMVLGILLLIGASLVEVAMLRALAGPLEVAGLFRDSVLGRLFLGVFEIFARTISARALYPDLIFWGLLGLSTDLALAVLVIRLASRQDLGIHLLEAVGGKSSKTADIARELPGHLPRFPWLGGAGPIAWRQLLSSMRSAHNIAWIMILMGAAVGPLLIVAAAQGMRAGSVTGGIVWLIFFVPMLFQFDFRTEVIHMDVIRALPVSSWALSLGEIVPPTLLTTIVQVMLLSSFAVLGHASHWLILLAMLFTLPFNGLMFCIENLLFLLFPASTDSLSVGSISYFGRHLAFFLAKTLLLAPCCVLAVVLGGLAFTAASQSWPVFFLVCWVALLLEAAALIPCVAWAYRRLDVSVNLLG